MEPSAAVVTAYRALLDRGLITGTAGNVSVRHGAGMRITPSSVPAAALTEGSLCEVDLDTGLVTGARPSSEWLLHAEVYRRTDAGAVVHTHSLAATAVSLVADELPAVHYYIERLGGPVPVAAYATYGSEDLARAVGEGIAGRSALILRNHGAVTVGESLDEAVERAELLEWLSELYLKASAAGTPRVLSAEDLEDVRAQPARIVARDDRHG